MTAGGLILTDIIPDNLTLVIKNRFNDFEKYKRAEMTNQL